MGETEIRRVPVRTYFSVSTLLVVIMMSGACAFSPPALVLEDHDYRLRHRSEVQPVMTRVAIPFEQGEASISHGVRHKLDEYFAAYTRAGRGMIEMTVYRDGSDDSVLRERVTAVKVRARAQGLRPSDINIAVADAVQDGVSVVDLAFLSHTISVPTCGDWTRDNLKSFDNAIASNFGCATQANLGTMVADPGDLVGRRGTKHPEPSTVGDANIIRVLTRHNAGETTSSADNNAGPAAAIGATGGSAR